jgi:hypothetical protein
MMPADGDGLVMSNRALEDLGLDDATRADFAACWDILCAAPPPELAESHIHAAAALAARASHSRLPNSGRSLAKAAVISAAAFVGTTGLAAADVLPPAAVNVVETVANTVRNAVDPIPPELSTPAVSRTPAPSPAVRAVAPPPTTEPADAAEPTTVDDPSTTAPTAPSTSVLAETTTTVTSIVHDVTTTTAVPDDGTATAAGSDPSTTTTTVPDDGTATAAGAGSTTTTTPGSTNPTEPSSTTTTTPHSTTP